MHVRVIAFIVVFTRKSTITKIITKGRHYRFRECSNNHREVFWMAETSGTALYAVFDTCEASFFWDFSCVLNNDYSYHYYY